VEYIKLQERILAIVVRSNPLPEKTEFLTEPEFNLQAGFVVCPTGEEIPRHVHHPLERHIVGTSEVLIVKQGTCELDVYSEDQELQATRELREGDVALLIGGGHGVRAIEDTVFFEVKQGPYTGLDEKERF